LNQFWTTTSRRAQFMKWSEGLLRDRVAAEPERGDHVVGGEAAANKTTTRPWRMASPPREY
jgi:hypothetical protein